MIVLGGGRILVEDTWRPVQEQGVGGLGIAFGRERWPVDIEVALQYSTSVEQRLRPLPVGHLTHDSEIYELDLGILKSWRPGRTRSFIGGGLAVLSIQQDLADDDLPGGRIENDDTSLGAFLHGGVVWRLGKAFDLGVESRLVAGTNFTLLDVDVVPDVSFEVIRQREDADYVQLNLVVGWGFKGH